MQEVIAALMSSSGKDVIYLMACLAGLYAHYLVAKKNGRTAAANFADYWLVETPGLSLATFITLATAAGAVLKSGVLDSMDMYSLLLMGFGKAYLFDSVIQAPPTVVAPPAAADAPKPSQAGFVRLPLLLAMAVLSFALLAGCGMFGDAKPVISGAPASCKSTDPTTKAVTVDPVCAEAFDIINQANVLLIAVDKTVTERFNAGIWTRDQALVYFRKTSDAAVKLDQASLLFSAGTYTSAKSQAEATKTILLLIQKEVAAAAAKSG